MCRSLGCLSDTECATIPSGTYVCRDLGGGLAGCVEACSTADDCSLGVPYADADNFACDAGVCRGLGCLSDAECAAIPGGTYVCRDLGGGVAGCIQACSNADDCSLGVPYADADNFACEAGVCRGLGCLSDAECAAIPSGTYVCR